MDHFFASSTFYRILLRHNPEGEAIAQKSKVFEDPIKIFSPKTSISLPIVGVFIDTVAQQTSKRGKVFFHPGFSFRTTHFSRTFSHSWIVHTMIDFGCCWMRYSFHPFCFGQEFQVLHPCSKKNVNHHGSTAHGLPLCGRMEDLAGGKSVV